MTSTQRPGDNFDPTAWGDDSTSVSSRRPGTVLAGCILAWVGAAFGTLVAVLFISASGDSALLDDLTAEQRAEAAEFFQVVGTVLLIWCPTVMLAAFFAFRRAKWAAVTLVVMGVLWTLICIFNALSGGGFGVVLAVAWTVASITLVYFVRQSREWYAMRR